MRTVEQGKQLENQTADFNILYKLIASQLSACGYDSASFKLFLNDEEMPQPSHWLMHLVAVGRDVLGITGFNFHENPVTPHTSFVNSLQPHYSYPQLVQISDLECPTKHSSMPQSLQLYTDKEPHFSEKNISPVEIPDKQTTPSDIGTITNTYTGPTLPSDNSTICVGLNVPKPPSQNNNLETVIDRLNNQLDVLNTEIRDEINDLSVIPPDQSPPQNATVPCTSVANDTVSAEQEEKSDTEMTTRMIDRLFSEKPAPSPPENSVKSPPVTTGLTIEELEPITVSKPKRKAKRNNAKKEGTKRKTKSVTVNNPAAPGNIKAPERPEVNQGAGETEFLSDLQRAITSNISKTPTPPKKTRAPRNSRKRQSVPMISLDERAQTSTRPSAQEDPTMNSKLLTELHRLLTQNNIRSALQSDKKKKMCTRPSLDSPPYIRPPQDSSSMDGTRFTLDKPSMFPCQQCNKEFKTKQCLKRHISRHLGVKLHVCSYCNKRFNDKSNLKRHVVTHINLRKFPCDVCNQAFFRKEVMERHKRRFHTVQGDVLNCRFKKCAFNCNVPYKLVEHIQTIHFQNYRYNCDKCQYKTQHNMNFVKHLRVHSDDRPYKCPKCGKGFKQPNALKKHSEIHVDRPHKCEICLKTFCLELALRIHYENNHGPRAAQKKLHEKKRREILRKYREQHFKKISFVNV